MKMNSYNIITVTRNKGLRAVRGATFKLSRLSDGRHFIKCKAGNNGDGMQIDAGLLTNPLSLVAHHTRQKTGESGGTYTQSEVTLQNVGIAVDNENDHVLIKPIASDLPHVAGLSGVCDPVLVWFPEEELVPINTGITKKEAHWIMPGLVRLLTMAPLYMEWRNPQDRMQPPVSMKVECHSGECFLEERHSKTDSRLRAYK
jgi:hypothetical protein